MAKKKVKRAAPPARCESKAEKAAELRRQLAKLEVDGEDEGEDEDEPEPERGLTVAGGGAALERVLERGLSALGSFGRMLVEDQTEVKPGQKGDPVKFTRNAGHVRGVTLDGQGRVKAVDFQPEEWPPRREAF